MSEKIICHLIAGFLGAGKTNFIQQLASYKPQNERWAILVNEVGLQTYPVESFKTQNIVVKTVLGGCLCCTAGLPFRVALNDMIKDHKPDRIFIEPAGAGHLDNIKTLLQGEFYLPIIELADTQCLLNITHLNNPDIAEHSSYLGLIEQADNLLVYAGNALEKAEALSLHYKKPLTILHGTLEDVSLLSKR